MKIFQIILIRNAWRIASGFLRENIQEILVEYLVLNFPVISYVIRKNAENSGKFLQEITEGTSQETLETLTEKREKSLKKFLEAFIKNVLLKSCSILQRKLLLKLLIDLPKDLPKEYRREFVKKPSTT